MRAVLFILCSCTVYCVRALLFIYCRYTVGLTTLQPSCTNYLEVWELHSLETLGARPGMYGIALLLPFTLYRKAVLFYCSYTIYDRGVTLTPHSLLVLWS
jgi:hypothetical protein